jgi:hypothetical protein
LCGFVSHQLLLLLLLRATYLTLFFFFFFLLLSHTIDIYARRLSKWPMQLSIQPTVNVIAMGTYFSEFNGLLNFQI